MSMTVLYYPEVSKDIKVITVLCAVATMVIKVELLTPPTIRACSSWCSIKEVAEKSGGGDVCGGDGGGGDQGR